MANLVGVAEYSDGKLRKLDQNDDNPELAAIDAVNQEILNNIVYLNNIVQNQYQDVIQWAMDNDTQIFFPDEAAEPIEATVGQPKQVRLWIGDGDGTKNILNNVATIEVAVDGDAQVVGGPVFTFNRGEILLNITKPTPGLCEVTISGGNTGDNISKISDLTLMFV